MAFGQDIKAGRAYVELMLRDKDFYKRLGLAGQGLKKWAIKAAKWGSAIGAAATIGAVKAASDLEETMNKFNVVFGEQSKRVKAWGDEFASQVGRSRKQIADFMANSQDLFVPLGFEPGAAEEMSKQVTQLSIDLASFNNMQDADTIRDLHAALTGSGEVMKKYGVIVSEAAVKQEALNMGLDPKKITDQQKVQARLNIILRGTTAAQGDAVRSSGSLANQMKALQAEVMNLAADFGQVLLPVVQSFAKNAIEWIRTAGNFIANHSRQVMVYIRDLYVNTFGTMMFVIHDFGKIWKTVSLGAQLRVVQFGEQVKYFFGEFGPELLKRFGMAFIELGKIIGTVLVNAARNTALFFESIAQRKEFTPVSILDGYTSAMADLPPVAKRQITELEKQLKSELDQAAEDLVVSYDDYVKKFSDDIPLPQIGSAGSVGESSSVDPTVNRRFNAAQNEVFSTFSAAAAAAQSGGGERSAERRHKEQKKILENIERAIKQQKGILLA